MCFLISWTVSKRKVGGIPTAAHVGLAVREVAPDFADGIEGHLRRVFQTGEPVSSVELQGGTLHAPDTMRKWLCSFYPLREADGTVSAASVISIDITDRKRAEEALNQSEARNRDLVEHAVKADPTQLEQMLMNLCLNARDAMPDDNGIDIHGLRLQNLNSRRGHAQTRRGRRGGEAHSFVRGPAHSFYQRLFAGFGEHSACQS